MNRWLGVVALAVMGMLLFGPPYEEVIAQQSCPSSQACLTWSAPTQFTDSTSIPSSATITYRIYRRTGTGPLVALQPDISTRAATLANQPRGSNSYYVTAIVGGAESAPSNVVVKTIRFGGPTEGAIEAPTDGAIER